ncbi:cytochrome c biogenesis protein CcdA, partial [Methylobacterium sp. WL122]
MVTSLGLAFLAGILSVLSPCVLPLLPLVLGAAASEHRLGP